MTNQAWETLSNQAVAGCGVIYFLAMLAYLGQWAAGRGEPVAAAASAGNRPVVFGRFAYVLTAFATVIHFVALVGRGMAADPDRVPWGNMYEFTLTASFVVTLTYVVLNRRHVHDWLGPWVVLLIVIVLMADVLWLYEPVAPLTEALNSPWLVIHVVAAIIATGMFTLGGVVSILFLLRSSGRLKGLPEADVLDRMAYRLHAFAFPVWTFAALIAGPIWAYYAWSRYWGWDPKEIWAFITWVVYAAYLHARATAGWKGRNAAIIALIGLATLWFNFIGINFFFGGSSIHSYSK
ncbi:c-type cytochrome biogenesis protein CcsB [Nocardioides cavernaquae]|uniref:C-type cytochrome biogenesis protein CcsB n=1 Tax=Nocardioides cavernaquae TaxID=2321396 RepID=A0A3A5H816_9ACTN|nr:c-type cytochrome biogenesis protein CcsB [Nocardioides cavernaquae]RJS46121.1 c-type cytochrome biogenesis protein CcsB [Nocardioides cavernaquae]